MSYTLARFTPLWPHWAWPRCSQWQMMPPLVIVIVVPKTTMHAVAQLL